MKKRHSLLFRLLLAITGAMVCGMLIVLLLSESKLKQIIDKGQEHFYFDKLTAIMRVLELHNGKLPATGLMEAHEEGVMDFVVQSLRSSQYRLPDQQDHPIILDAEGNIVMHPQLEKGNSFFVGAPYVQQAMVQKQGTLNYTDEFAEARWCVFATFPVRDWLVLYTIPTKYKYRDLASFKRNITGVVLVVSGLVLMVLWVLLYQVVTKPIAHLSRASKAIAEGDLQIELHSSRNDEVGELTKSFVLMQQAVKKQLEGTEAHNELLREEINQRKQATAALVESEKRYREIFNTPTDAILLHDAVTGDLVDVNQGMLEMFGCSYEEALQLQFKGFIAKGTPYTFRRAREKIEQALYEGPQRFEWLVKRLNGEIFWIEVSLKKVVFAHTPFILAVARDINKQKLAVKKLEEEQEKLAVTLRSIADGVIATDKNGRVILLNHAGELLTGWKQDEAQGLHFHDVLELVIDDDQDAQSLFSIKGVMKGSSNHYEKSVTLLDHDRNKHTISLSATAILGKNKEVFGAVVVFRDIAGILKMEAEALKAKKLESFGLLAGGLAHDFNNIIFGIQGNVNLALAAVDKEDKIFRYLSAADKATVRATDLTQQLLTFSKGGEPVKRKMTVTALPEEAARLVIGGSNMELSYSCVPDLWSVEVDAAQISQVIQNIVLNSIQAMDETGVISISCTNHDQKEGDDHAIVSPGKYIHISIEDQGKGISEEDQEKIFDPYFTTKQEGQGLGLAICHSLIKNHDGFLAVDSEPEKGTVFHLYLPAVEGGEQAAVPTVESLEKWTPTPEITVMIMDDEEIIRELVSSILEQAGYKVVAVEDGIEAIKLYQEMMRADGPPDVVIMDLIVPSGVGGKEAAAEIKKMDPSATLVVSSGSSNDPVLVHYQKYGFCRALPKPYREDELCRCVESCVSPPQ